MKMHPTRVLLVLLNVIIIAAPLIGVVVVYQNNLQDLVLPPQASQILSGNLGSGGSVQIPQFVNATYDPNTRIGYVLFSYLNPFSFDLTINSASADVQCTAHHSSLGHAELEEEGPITVPSGETTYITVVFTWTQTAETHFQLEHPNEKTTLIDLVNLEVDVSGINVLTPDFVGNIEVQLP